MTEDEYFKEMFSEYERFKKVWVSDLLMDIHEKKWVYKVRLRDSNWSKSFSEYNEAHADREAFIGAVARCQQLSKTSKKNS